MLAGRCIFFCVYLYVCILLLEVYIQGCVFIYKNAYLKRVYKKEKCIHYVAHFFLPAAAGRMLKMYTHACTHKKPSQRAGYISKNAYICRHIFSVVLCIHMHTLFSSSPNFAGILPQQAYPQKYPSPTFTDFSHIFFAPLFLRKSKLQTKVAVKKNTWQDETGRKIVQKKTAEQKSRKNIKIKEFVETKKCFRKPRFFSLVDKKQKKNKEK